MKQRLIFLVGLIAFILCVGVIESRAQSIVVAGDTIVQVTDSNFEAIFDKYTAKAGDGINKLLSSVKENFTDEAEMVWALYVKKYQIPFFIGLIIAIFSIIILAPAVILYSKAKETSLEYNGNKNNYYNKEWYDFSFGIWAIILWIISGTLLISGIITMLVNMSMLIIPEYYVIQDLISIIK